MELKEYNRMLKQIELQYSKALSEVVDEVFAVVHVIGGSMSELASVAGLAAQTVHNLAAGKTRYPQFRTLWKLCRTIGVKIELQRDVKVKKFRVVG